VHQVRCTKSNFRDLFQVWTNEIARLLAFRLQLKKVYDSSVFSGGHASRIVETRVIAVGHM